MVPSAKCLRVLGALLIVLINHRNATYAHDHPCAHSLASQSEPPFQLPPARFKRAQPPQPPARSFASNPFVQAAGQFGRQALNKRPRTRRQEQEQEQQESGNFERPPSTRMRVGQAERVSEQTSGDELEQDKPTKEPRVIETAVFIDQALDNKFNGLSNGLVELNKLVLTIMKQVQYLFQYSSIQVSLDLKLVLIEHLRESERQFGLPIPGAEQGDIDAYLGNFCNWQRSRLERETRLWWDHAILLSG